MGYLTEDPPALGEALDLAMKWTVSRIWVHGWIMAST
jgi:hypothetical protein